MMSLGIRHVVRTAILLTAVRGLGQKTDLPQGVWVNCNSSQNDVVVSPVLTAKNGSQAWVEVVSVAAPLRGECLNTTTLWTSRGPLNQYVPIFRQLPVYPNLQGNGMHMIDWSSDGGLLLTEMWQWNTEPNDAPIPRSILVFEPQKGAKHEVDLSRLINDQKGRDCTVDFDVLGFTSDNWVALKAQISTFYDVDETETTKATNLKCKESTQWLAINPFTQERRSIPVDFQAIHYSISN